MRSLVLSFTVLTALGVTPVVAQTAAPQNDPTMSGPGMTSPGTTNPGMTEPGMAGPGMNGPAMNGPGMSGPGPGPGYSADQSNAGMMGDLPAPPSHQPRSRRATNINGQNTRSKISPSLPSAAVGTNGDASEYLRAARAALSRGQTGQAQEALENAETYMLNRSVPAGAVNQPDQDPAVANINSALQALGSGDRGQAMNLIDRTIPMTMQAANGMGGTGGPGMNGGMMGPPPGMSGPPTGTMNGGYPPRPQPMNPPPARP
ncbi:MAG: hypothetical protein M3Y41_13290 [Pseudomonadota bacterium]|nr:hypothetical protein [Pseudomonadota bacterium]